MNGNGIDNNEEQIQFQFIFNLSKHKLKVILK